MSELWYILNHWVTIAWLVLAALYAVIGEDDPQAGRTVRLYHNPLVPWIWIGAIVMALGALISLSDRRLRLAVPARRRRHPAAA